LVIGPEGDVVHQAGHLGEIIPFELDFERVRRVREKGIHNLGQVLKSFRDSKVKYPQYTDDFSFLPLLGELKVPE
jgi:hypothetical protein